MLLCWCCQRQEVTGPHKNAIIHGNYICEYVCECVDLFGKHCAHNCSCPYASTNNNTNTHICMWHKFWKMSTSVLCVFAIVALLRRILLSCNNAAFLLFYAAASSVRCNCKQTCHFRNYRLNFIRMQLHNSFMGLEPVGVVRLFAI